MSEDIDSKIEVVYDAGEIDENHSYWDPEYYWIDGCIFFLQRYEDCVLVMDEAPEGYVDTCVKECLSEKEARDFIRTRYMTNAEKVVWHRSKSKQA